MSFPSNPVGGQSHTIGTRTWFWDGQSWNLQPGNLSDTSDGVKVLDDLLDVDTGGPPQKSDTFNYYINDVVNLEDAWGRYRADVSTKEIAFNKKDLDAKELKALYDFTYAGSTAHKFVAFDGSFETDAMVVAKVELDHAFIFEYDNLSTVQIINNNGNSKLFGLTATDFGALLDRSILIYNQADEMWRPGENRGSDDGGKITIGPFPPNDSVNGDIWIDSSNYYMYLYMDGVWIALTGPEGGGGGSGGPVNNSDINLVSTRGVKFDGGTASGFSLNQPRDQDIDVETTQLTSLGGKPSNPEVGDVWIDAQTYYFYTWNGDFWVGVSGNEEGNNDGTNRIEMPCKLIGGKPDSIYCQEETMNIGGNAIISPTPPKFPSKGDMWFDSEHLELRVWYVTANSYGRWVSSTHPGMRPELGLEENPPPIRLTGPAVAQENVFSGRYVATIGHNIADQDLEIKWSTSAKGANIVESNGGTTAVIKFIKFGTYSVTASINYRDEDGVLQSAADSVRTSVTILPPGTPIRYHVRVVMDQDNEPIFNIDGQNLPHLNLMRNRSYIFDQSHPSNEGFPFRFYRAQSYDVDGNLTDNIGAEYTDGVSVIGTNVEIIVPADAPIRLRYDSPTSVDKTMGWWIYPFDPDGQVNLEP